MKACYGTTKYCNAFLKGLPCNNGECLYLHDVGELRTLLITANLVHPLRFCTPQVFCSGQHLVQCT